MHVLDNYNAWQIMIYIDKYIFHNCTRGRRGRDRMVVCAISAYPH